MHRIFLVLIYATGRVNPRAIVQLGLGQLKDPITSLGSKPMPFQLVAQCLNRLHYHKPWTNLMERANKHVTVNMCITALWAMVTSPIYQFVIHVTKYIGVCNVQPKHILFAIFPFMNYLNDANSNSTAHVFCF
jgi:hypothetical protein